jgi:hypothetical protein
MLGLRYKLMIQHILPEESFQMVVSKRVYSELAGVLVY